MAIGYIASVTKGIRVDSGGVMLPNHAPLIVADTDTEAKYLATTFYQFFLSIIHRNHQLL